MNTSLRKVLAATSAVMLVGSSLSSIATAAPVAILGATASNAAAVVTVTKTGAFGDTNEIVSATIANLNGSAAGVTVSSYGGANADADTSAITLSGTPGTNTSYMVSFVTANGDFGAVQLDVGTPTSNSVIVNATVVPTLTMSVNSANADLGALSSSAVVDSASGTTVTVSTNAVGGYVLSAAATTSDATNMQLKSRAALGVAGTAGFGLYVSGGTNSTAAAGFNGTSAATAITGSAQQISSHNAPVANSTTLVKYSGGTSATTPAGAYSMTTTYTVSGSF